MRWALLLAGLALGACQKPGPELDPVLEAARGAIDEAQQSGPADETLDNDTLDNDKMGAHAGGDPAKPPPGYVAMSPLQHSGPSIGDAVFLVDESEKRVLPIFIGGTEALSIRLRLQKRRFVRPLTHDLMDEALSRLGAKLLHAQVDTLKENVFLGSIVLKSGDKIIKLDSRPSDAVALAIGNGVPIYVSSALLDEAAVSIDDVDGNSRPSDVSPLAL